MAQGHELEGRAVTEIEFAESMTLGSARTMQRLANEFDGIEVRLLDERVPEDAEEVAKVLNERRKKYDVSDLTRQYK